MKGSVSRKLPFKLKLLGPEKSDRLLKQERMILYKIIIWKLTRIVLPNLLNFHIVFPTLSTINDNLHIRVVVILVTSYFLITYHTKFNNVRVPVQHAAFSKPFDCSDYKKSFKVAWFFFPFLVGAFHTLCYTN